VFRWLIMMIGLGFAAMLGAAVEIFDLPRFKRKRQERERKKRERNEGEGNKILTWLSDALPY
jgi:hypothetical protein